jgi:hypothetical protein
MSSKTIWAFADVDDNLITSRRESPEAGSEVAAVDGKGVVCGWLTPKQKQFLGLLDGRVEMVLTTARTSKGVSQLQLPIAKGWAIVSFGGVIRMPDGQSEPRFRELMARGAVAAGESLKSLLARMQEHCTTHGVEARLRVAGDDGLDLFLSIKHSKRDLTAMAALRDVLAALLPAGWQLHFNGNFLAALPPFLGKDKAVQWFIDNVASRDDLTIGLGDSHTDLPFMGLCDLAVAPTGSQIFSQLKSGGNL